MDDGRAGAKSTFRARRPPRERPIPIGRTGERKRMAVVLRDRRRPRSPAGGGAVRSATPPAGGRPLGQTVALLYSAIAFLAVFLTAPCYAAASPATGGGAR